MKIAICLSGQPRSIEFASKSILNYFKNGTNNHTYDFFCHSWNYNTWKLRGVERTTFSDNEIVDDVWLREQLNKFSPRYTVINSELDTNLDSSRLGWKNLIHVPFGSLLYSAMISNFLKRKYEYENNFKYDCVFKIRYDSAFHCDTFPVLPDTMPQRTLYFPHLGRFPLEYHRFNASDCIYYGDSWGMDIASDLFRYVLNNTRQMQKEDDFDCFGPGTLMTEFCNNYNVDVRHDPNFIEIIYRKEVLGLDPLDRAAFDRIQDMHVSFYRNHRF